MKSKPTNSEPIPPPAAPGLRERLAALFPSIRPRRLIETGAGTGNASTTIIARLLKEMALDDATLFSIELNPKSCSKALAHLTREGLNASVKILNGLSVPRASLPAKAADLPRLPDDMIGQALREFANKADFVLLGSVAPLAAAEFTYVISRLRGACWIATADTPAIREQIAADERFSMSNPDCGDGFCVTRFAPTAAKKRKGTAA